jgi:aminoglycoside phosphotransferase (APT) family kinase protein
VYRWIEGERLRRDRVTDLDRLAEDLAAFLVALRRVNTADGPRAGAHNFYRGGSLRVYDEETRRSVAYLADEIDPSTALDLWHEALETSWQLDPVWIHGDVAEGNLLAKDGTLCAVIDFGCIGVGDPACDLVIAWTFFNRNSRDRFRRTLGLDRATWRRGRAWPLWKALITLVQSRENSPSDASRQRTILREIFVDYQAERSY